MGLGSNTSGWARAVLFLPPHLKTTYREIQIFPILRVSPSFTGRLLDDSVRLQGDHDRLGAGVTQSFHLTNSDPQILVIAIVPNLWRATDTKARRSLSIIKKLMFTAYFNCPKLIARSATGQGAGSREQVHSTTTTSSAVATSDVCVKA